MYAGCYLAAMYAGCYLAARQYRESQQLSESRAELGTQAPDAETQQIVVEELRETLKKRLEINDALPTNIENNIHDESATLWEALVSRCTECTECTEDAEFTESAKS